MACRGAEPFALTDMRHELWHLPDTYLRARTTWEHDKRYIDCKRRAGTASGAQVGLTDHKHVADSDWRLLAVPVDGSKFLQRFGLPKGRHPEALDACSCFAFVLRLRAVTPKALTLSGATGSQLKTELLQYLKKRGEELAVTLDPRADIASEPDWSMGKIWKEKTTAEAESFVISHCGGEI